jgi:hypothetical protein
MYGIILLFICISAQALSLERSKIYPTVMNEFELDIGYFLRQRNSSWDQVATNIYLEFFREEFYQLNGFGDDDKFFRMIAREIALEVSLQSSNIQQKKWDTIINHSLRIIKIVSITATIDNFIVGIQGKIIMIEQIIPKLFATYQKCARTGYREYIFVGARAVECYDYQVQQELDKDEIAQINQNLMSRVEEAQLLLGN